MADLMYLNEKTLVTNKMETPVIGDRSTSSNQHVAFFFHHPKSFSCIATEVDL